MTDTPPYLELANAGIESMIPVAHRMGVHIVELAPGHVVAEVPLDGNTNHIGSMYAGVLFTVGEILGGALGIATFDPAEFYPTIRDLKIDFRRPAKSTVRATTDLDADTVTQLTKEAATNGKANFVLEAQLTDADGQLVATTLGNYQIRKHGT